MKTLQIDKVITGFDGKPIIIDLNGTNATVKSILLQCIGAFFTSPNAEENIEANRMGHKLYDADGTIELEDAEFKLLDKAVKKTLNDQRYSVVMMTPVLEFMEEAKRED